MAKNTRPTAQKRAREKAQQARQQEKQQRRAEARDRKVTGTREAGGEDPDLAGIRPGPQPPPEWMDVDSTQPEAEEE
jgi:hypothetical protein